MSPPVWVPTERVHYGDYRAKHCMSSSDAVAGRGRQRFAKAAVERAADAVRIGRSRGDPTSASSSSSRSLPLSESSIHRRSAQMIAGASKMISEPRSVRAGLIVYAPEVVHLF